MKPKTKYEKEVVRLSKRLPPLADRYKKLADSLIDYKEARRFRNRMTHIVHFVLVTTKGDWQVLRHFYLYASFKYKKPFENIYYECMQQWFKDGMYVFLARNRREGYCEDAWCGEMSIKKSYGHCSVLGDPRLIGYDKAFYIKEQPQFKYLKTDEEAGLRVDDMFRAVNASPYWETIINKAPQLFKFLEKRGMTNDREKASAVKVALRHGYNIESPEWCDLVDMLAYLGKDLHNPKYVAPADLKEMHDDIMKQVAAKRKKMRVLAIKRNQIRNEKKALREIEREKKAVKMYHSKRKKFFGLLISGNGIEIHVLKSVNEFAEEGIAMNHCVFSNKYYDTIKKPNCLIMSATKDGERVETIEVDLKDYKIVQSRGCHNSVTPYHNTIIGLVESNMDKIRSLNGRKVV